MILFYRFITLSAKKIAFVRLLTCTTVVISSLLQAGPAQAIDWTTRINFDEPAFMKATTALLDESGSSTMTYDLFTGSGLPGVAATDGADGTDDLTVVVTLVESTDNPWSKTEADYSISSSGSFRSDWKVNISDCSSENAYAYVKYDFLFHGALSNIQAGQFTTRHTSTNGESEAYESTLITTNGVGNSIIENRFGTYLNTDYVAGISMSEHVFDVTDPDAQGGPVVNNDGVWAVDDFNTSVAPLVDESPNTNPQTGDGGTNDDQEVDGTDFGLNAGDVISQITYYFGLYDVAFDTNGDGCTQTNTSPSAGVTWFDIGYEDSTAVELATFDAQPAGDLVLLNWSTATEIDHAGFYIYRGPTHKGPWTQLNRSLIPASGGPFAEAHYSFTDQPVSGVVYYLLEDVDFSGSRSAHDAILYNANSAKNYSPTARLYVPMMFLHDKSR